MGARCDTERVLVWVVAPIFSLAIVVALVLLALLELVLGVLLLGEIAFTRVGVPVFVKVNLIFTL